MGLLDRKNLKARRHSMHWKTPGAEAAPRLSMKPVAEEKFTRHKSFTQENELIARRLSLKKHERALAVEEIGLAAVANCDIEVRPSLCEQLFQDFERVLVEASAGREH